MPPRTRKPVVTVTGPLMTVTEAGIEALPAVAVEPADVEFRVLAKLPAGDTEYEVRVLGDLTDMDAVRAAVTHDKRRYRFLPDPEAAHPAYRVESREVSRSAWEPVELGDPAE